MFDDVLASHDRSTLYFDGGGPDPGGLEEPLLTPWQPTRKARLARTSNPPAAFPGCLEQISLALVSSVVKQKTVALYFMTVSSGRRLVVTRLVRTAGWR
jgi:hypothetical protein